MGHYLWENSEDYSSHNAERGYDYAPPFIVKMVQNKYMNLWYCWLLHPLFLVMMFASKLSRRSNRCAQVNVTDFGWVRAFPMASISEAHKTCSLLFVSNGVSPACTCDNAKEMVQGKFYQKLKDTAYHLNQLKPYTPWSNAAERETKELKKGVHHKLLKSRAPKHCVTTA